MSVKRFCDVCKKEIAKDNDAVSNRIKGVTVSHGTRVMIEVIVGTGQTWNKGDVCVRCVLDAVEKVGNPPMQAVAS